MVVFVLKTRKKSLFLGLEKFGFQFMPIYSLTSQSYKNQPKTEILKALERLEPAKNYKGLSRDALWKLLQTKLKEQGLNPLYNTENVNNF